MTPHLGSAILQQLLDQSLFEMGALPRPQPERAFHPPVKRKRSSVPALSRYLQDCEIRFDA